MDGKYDELETFSFIHLQGLLLSVVKHVLCGPWPAQPAPWYWQTHNISALLARRALDKSCTWNYSLHRWVKNESASAQVQKSHSLCKGGFLEVKLGSVADDGDAHNEFITMGKKSIASDPDKIWNILLKSYPGLQDKGCTPSPIVTAGAANTQTPFPALAASSEREAQTWITTPNTSD